MPLRCFRQPVKAVITSTVKTIDTIYQNTTGRPLLVHVTVLSRVYANGDYAYVTALVKNSSPPDTARARCGVLGYAGATEISQYGALIFMVPNNYYYRLTATVGGASGAYTLTYWVEVEL